MTGVSETSRSFFSYKFQAMLAVPFVFITQRLDSRKILWNWFLTADWKQFLRNSFDCFRYKTCVGAKLKQTNKQTNTQTSKKKKQNKKKESKIIMNVVLCIITMRSRTYILFPYTASHLLFVIVTSVSSTFLLSFPHIIKTQSGNKILLNR